MVSIFFREYASFIERKVFSNCLMCLSTGGSIGAGGFSSVTLNISDIMDSVAVQGGGISASLSVWVFFPPFFEVSLFFKLFFLFSQMDFSFHIVLLLFISTDLLFFLFLHP